MKCVINIISRSPKTLHDFPTNPNQNTNGFQDGISLGYHMGYAEVCNHQYDVWACLKNWGIFRKW